MSTPPCTPFRGNKPQTAQTFVVNITGGPTELLSEWAAKRLFDGDGAIARIRLLNEETFLVITTARPSKADYTALALKKSIALLPGNPEPLWVRPLTRRLLALFAWSDAATGGTGDTLALPETATNHPACVWRQHPSNPLPFFIHECAKWPEEEKLAWIRQDLGEGADLTDFARRWLELFSETLRGAVPQKSACLKLFGEYSGANLRKESDLPPEELVPFQRLWDPKAPERCSECSKAAPEGRFQLRRCGRHFCSEACANAGVRLACQKCGEAVDTEWPRCEACGWGLKPGKQAASSALDRMIEESELALRSFLQITRAAAIPDESHEAAWKKRRRA